MSTIVPSSENVLELRFNDPDLKVKAVMILFLRSGKVVVKLGDGRIHYTLHPGHASGVIDFHRTDEKFPGGHPCRQETLAFLPKAAIEGGLQAIGPHLVADFISVWRPLRLGWLIRRRLGIGPRLPTGVELGALNKISIREGPAQCSEPIASWMRPPEFYEDVLEHTSAAYILYDCKKRSTCPYGAMLTYGGLRGHVQMRWAKFRDLRRWAAKWEPIVVETWKTLNEKTGS